MKQINRVIPISSFAVFSFEFAVSVLTAPVTHQALDLQKNEIFSSAIPVPFHGTQKIFGSRPCPKGGSQILWLLANPAFGGTHGVGGQDIDDLLGSG
jgi:hypothetical protein